MIDFMRLLVTFSPDTPIAKRHAGREIIHAVSGVESVLMLEDKGKPRMTQSRLAQLQSVANVWAPSVPRSVGADMSELIEEVCRLREVEVNQKAEIEKLDKTLQLALRLLDNRT